MEMEDLVPIQPEEESRQEEDPQEAIHHMAIAESLHLHRSELRPSRQEEQVYQEAIQDHQLAHLRKYLLNDQLTHGHN